MHVVEGLESRCRDTDPSCLYDAATRTISAVEPNLLYYGDNVDVLRRHVKDEIVDLV